MPALDRFSAQAADYARYRIDYPAALYEWLLPQVAARERAWDCATGNGQVAAVLADSFVRVDATDLSEKQLAQAPPRPNLHYQTARAEHTPFPAQRFDLITVAQAVHWFEAEAYHQEVRRVARPGAVLAEWGYGLVQISPEIDALIGHFYRDTMGPYWDANRWHIDDEYARIPFPFARVRRAHFAVQRQWSAEWFLHYLGTWSSVAKYQQERGEDAVALIAEEVTQRWGPGERKVVFPVFARAGRIE
ncbi:class I SAM-dependent methyltransferase [Hymenobacter sp. BT770]|uniref:class I SAM-dependent methyltransferase n=1 Tax=Hymenobacter sp. BT770 TaxID=2886942 RepID=UPI001D105524|nr:class I SAM-dependent methyltransferase [Hymenobacter sp. BT770]MCC3154686.1 class I SAM-dependent methyltransferase [Hymenobacter sp. BT770]MDO3416740.1 class I SAM-dependent methyltransferase [Hymenobacter sp. BT770]